MQVLIIQRQKSQGYYSSGFYLGYIFFFLFSVPNCLLVDKYLI